MDTAGLLAPASLAAFAQVVLIDVALAGDNAVVVGALAAGLPEADRKRVILLGIVAAFVLRVVFALGVTWLLAFGPALILGGGVLLLYVAWRMWRELRRPHAPAAPMRPAKSFGRAALGVAVADVSMSLDNVLAVAGAARDRPVILIAGLVLSVALMGFAANLIARYIERFRWIAWAGLATVVFVAVRMVRAGAEPFL
jgi:YjbE family integral membrane protein